MTTLRTMRTKVRRFHRPLLVELRLRCPSFRQEKEEERVDGARVGDRTDTKTRAEVARDDEELGCGDAKVSVKRVTRFGTNFTRSRYLPDILVS